MVDGVSDAMLRSLTLVLDAAKADAAQTVDQEAVVADVTAALTSARGDGDPALSDEEIVREVLSAYQSATNTVRSLSTREQVGIVMAAYVANLTGDPAGTVLLDSETGDIATRVVVDGAPVWKITDRIGTTRRDERPTLPGWTVLHAVTA